MEELKNDWIQLTKWDEHFDYPTLGTMKMLAYKRKENGADTFLVMINGRLYVSVSKFNEWMYSHLEDEKKN